MIGKALSVNSCVTKSFASEMIREVENGARKKLGSSKWISAAHRARKMATMHCK